MDTGTEHEPIVREPAPSATDLPAPRKRHTLRTVLITVGVTLLVLTAIGFLIEPRGELLVEDFESKPIGFSTDSDPRVDLRVQDGAYRIEIRDASTPQYTRHVFSRTYDGLSFEATIVHPNDVGDEAFASIGCWVGESSYLLASAPNGDVGLVETISERTGERRELTDLIPVEGARGAGQPNRFRIDCVGGRDGGPTVVSAYVNGRPVVSVEIEDGYDSFDAIGFFVAARTDGATFTADDVVVTAVRPEPGMSPIPALP